MQKIISSIFFLLVAGQAISQTIIKGEVKDVEGLTIPGANIYLKNTFDGAVSLLDGTYSFSTSEAGDQTLIISFVGYKTLEKPLQITSGELLVNVVLVEEINKIDGVTITAGAFEASDVKKVIVLKPLDIVTTASAAGDIMGAINTLPGTAAVGESGRLFVRGGEGYETKVFIDGLEVRNAFGATAPNVPTRGRFSPFLFKGTTFSTGGYSAEYGQSLSSALVLNSFDLAHETQADISLMSVGGDVAYTKKWENTSVTGKLQYTDLRPYHNPNLPGFQNSVTPSYHDFSVNAAVLLKENIILYCSSSNLFGNENIFGYQFADQPNEQGFYESQPIGQGARRFIFMGLFITLTKDKKANHLDNL